MASEFKDLTGEYLISGADYVNTQILEANDIYCDNMYPYTAAQITVNGDMTITQDLTINGNEILVGNQIIQGNLETTGTIKADSGLISNTLVSRTTNTDLTLSGNGSGIVQISDNTNVSGSVTSNGLISDTLTSKTTNTDLTLSGNGSGIIQLNDNTNVTGSITSTTGIITDSVTSRTAATMAITATNDLDITTGTNKNLNISPTTFLKVSRIWAPSGYGLILDGDDVGTPIFLNKDATTQNINLLGILGMFTTAGFPKYQLYYDTVTSAFFILNFAGTVGIKINDTGTIQILNDLTCVTSNTDVVNINRLGTTYGKAAISSGSGNYFTGISANEVCIGATGASGRVHLGINMNSGTSSPHITLGPTFMNVNSLANTFTSTQDGSYGASAISTAGGIYAQKNITSEQSLIANTITSRSSNTDLTLSANGTGIIQLNDNTNVTGFLSANNCSIDRPLNVRGNPTSGTNQWITLRDSTNTSKWFLADGAGVGLDFAETGIANNRLFVRYGGGVGIGNQCPNGYLLEVSGSGRFIGQLRADDVTDSSSISTGSLITSGGLGVAKKLYVGTGIYLPGSSTEFNYYEQYTVDCTWRQSGSPLGTVANGLSITRVGNVCTCRLLKFVINLSATTLDITGIPARFRPANDEYFPVMVSNSATRQMGALRITTAGNINFYSTVTLSNFSAASGGLVENTCFTYSLA